MRNSRSYQLVSKHSIPGNHRVPIRKKIEGSTESLENRMDAVEQRVRRLEVTMVKALEQLKAMSAELKDLERKTMKLTPMEEQREDRWNEEIEIGLNFQKMIMVVNHQDQKKEVEPEIENVGNREQGSINEPISVIAKPEKGGGGDAKPPPKTLGGGATAEVIVQDRDLREGNFSLVTGSREGEKVEEMARGSDERLRNDEHWGDHWRRTPAKRLQREVE